jgi:hypothetical protein
MSCLTLAGQLKASELLLLALLALQPGCHRIPPLRPYTDAVNNQYLATASLIVVGVVEGDESLGTPVPSPPHSPLQLHKVTVHVENILKGAVPERSFPVYYFTFVNLNVGFRALVFHREPVRRVLWLRKDGGVYRTACDWQNCTVWIASGAHPGYRPDPDASLNQTLVDLTLTRGEGPVDNHQFAKELDQFVGRAGLEAYTIEKLRHLALTESSEVKIKACSDLWMYAHEKIDVRLRDRAGDSVDIAGCNCRDSGPGVVCQ